MRAIVAAAALLALAAGPAAAASGLPSGTYRLDKAHASLIFRVDHLGFSHWTARITGDFSLHGVTRPVALEATFNGGYAGHLLDW
jgi:polyisoprenoid-binding protein YceI